MRSWKDKWADEFYKSGSQSLNHRPGPDAGEVDVLAGVRHGAALEVGTWVFLSSYLIWGTDCREMQLVSLYSLVSASAFWVFGLNHCGWGEVSLNTIFVLRQSISMCVFPFGLQCFILLLLGPQCWDYKCIPPQTDSFFWDSLFTPISNSVSS